MRQMLHVPTEAPTPNGVGTLEVLFIHFIQWLGAAGKL